MVDCAKIQPTASKQDAIKYKISCFFFLNRQTRKAKEDQKEKTNHFNITSLEIYRPSVALLRVQLLI